MNYWHDEGRLQAIASSAPRANVETVIEVLGWQALFETIVAGEDVSAGKPDPEVFLKSAERLRVLPHECVVVEDAPAGIEAARRGGMRSIGVGLAACDANPDAAVTSLAALTADIWGLISFRP